MLVAQINKNIGHLIRQLAEKDIFTYRLGLARTILATSTLLTLLTNDPVTLFKIGNTFNPTRFDNQFYIFQKFNFFLIFGSENLYISKYIAIGILLLITSGWRPRYTCILHFWICISFNFSTTLLEGGDQIASNLSLILLPVLLLDGRKWHWSRRDLPKESFSKEINLIANYFLFIVKLQMCVLYFHSFVGKLPVKEWANGTAVYYWFNDPTFGMCDWLHPILDPILSNSLGVSIITWGAILLEILLFMAIVMNNKAKYVLLVFGLAFHFSIVIIHGLVSFFLSMAAGLLLYLWVDNPYGRLKPSERRLNNR